MRSRKRKFRLFMERFHPDERTRVVDVGVTDASYGEGDGAHPAENFFEALYPWPERITAVGLADFPRFRAAFPTVRFVQADGRTLPFADGEFDLGLSNAVVEHVGAREDQRAFVHELCRVARRIFVTTPNRWFPVEVHTLVPFVHWLPKTRADRVFQALGKRDAAAVNLLGAREFRALFPYRVEIVNTGVSLVAIGPAGTDAHAETEVPDGATLR